MENQTLKQNTHSVAMGYILWVFGFMGAHRFYYGKTKTGILWFCTFGILGIGWLIDLLLIPSMDKEADLTYKSGPIDYNLSWILLTFLGYLGIHRMYMGKWLTGIIYLLTGGLFFVGYLYDYCTLNEQISAINNGDLN
jgi:TM2 domain-containing membrane protein YozV